MPNALDTIFVTVIDRINAEIQMADDNPTNAHYGQSVTLTILYIGGTNNPAHAFRLRTYATEAARTADAEEDAGNGLLTSTKSPMSVVFTPFEPVAGGRYDHDNDPLTAPILRTAQSIL